MKFAEKFHTMERKSQNLMFTQKLSVNSDEGLEQHSRIVSCQKLLGTAWPPTSSGGDMPADVSASTTDKLNCKAKSPSRQNVSAPEQLSDAEDADDGDEERAVPFPAIDSVIEGHLIIRKILSDAGCGRRGRFDEIGSKLNAELTKYKSELKAYNTTTRGLEDKYQKITDELKEMQEQHDRFVSRSTNDTDLDTDSSSTTSHSGSEFSLKRKCPQVFNRVSSILSMQPQSNEDIPYDLKQNAGDESSDTRKQRKRTYSCQSVESCPPGTLQSRQYNKLRKADNKENVSLNKVKSPSLTPFSENRQNLSEHHHNKAGLKDVYKVLKSVLDMTQHAGEDVESRDLQSIIVNLQNEQTEFRNIIEQQQSCLHDYHSRCLRAQKIMQAQRIEIEKLNTNNHQLESEVSAGINQLRVKIDSKLRDVSHLPQMMREEQSKYERVSKENSVLGERLRGLQTEATQLKLKIEELGRRKAVTITRLKTAERDLKIFKNYNSALKHEKRKLNDESLKLKEQLETMQSASKRTMGRQREMSEKQRRELQKRVFELELKLSRSQNSTSSLIQERDNLIAELQAQLNSLVHNFEVSQKHIRVLRRHIYTLSNGGILQSNTSRNLVDKM